MIIKVSVIVPVFNDELGIKSTIDSLLDQDFPKNSYEIIVVDNGSTDNTNKVIRQYADKLIRVFIS